MSLESSIKTHYDALAAAYDGRWPLYNRCQTEWVLERLPAMSGAVLDLGCGTGLMLASIAHKSAEAVLTGADISPSMLEQAKKAAPAALLIEGDIENEAVQSKLPQADVVISLSMLHHLKDVKSHLRLIHRQLKPGGTAFISDFSRNGPLMNAADMYFRFQHDFYVRSLSNKALTKRVLKIFPRGIVEAAILRPGNFWRIQIFKLQKY